MSYPLHLQKNMIKLLKRDMRVKEDGDFHMLSKRDIEKELGKGIAVVPFIEKKLKDNSINLSMSEYAWGATSHTYYYNSTQVDDIIYTVEMEIPEQKCRCYKSRCIQAGETVVIERGTQKDVLLFPHATTYVETQEVLSTGGNIGGTCHSKVGTAAQGIGHIGTMMGPNYSGHCFVPIHNPTDTLIIFSVGKSFMSVVFNYLDTPMRESNATTSGHTDKFSGLGIHASQSHLDVLNEDWKRSHQKVIERMKCEETYIDFKKHLQRQRVSMFFSKKNIIFGAGLIAVCIILAVLAAFFDSKCGTTVWSDRFWTIMGAGVVVCFLQIIWPKK